MMAACNTAELAGRTVQLSGRDLADAIRLLRAIAPEGAVLETACPSRSELTDQARRLLLFRRLRSRVFPAAMFGEPAWDILLALYAAPDQQRPSLAAITDLVGAPATTALRWIDYLEAQGSVVREPDTLDRRVALVSLTDKAKTGLDSYLSQILRNDP
jgi:DNA-binding MarR family transcriptional regulator